MRESHRSGGEHLGLGPHLDVDLETNDGFEVHKLPSFLETDGAKFGKPADGFKSGGDLIEFFSSKARPMKLTPIGIPSSSVKGKRDGRKPREVA
jgi:hypothetical protein